LLWKLSGRAFECGIVGKCGEGGLDSLKDESGEREIVLH
jgi:hypothetical protein